MYLTQQTDYALRVLMYLAINKGRQVNIGLIARAYGISHSNLMKVVTKLTKTGCVCSTRGKNGGLVLGKDPSEIRIGQIVKSLEDVRMVSCIDPGGRHCIIYGSCRLGGIFEAALESFFAKLDEYTLADLTAPNRGLELLDETSEIFKRMREAESARKG